MRVRGYSVAPGTPDHDALQLLAAWAATEADRPTSHPASPHQQHR
ncbi:hypothetical protein ACGF4C_07720 [Streptomyces sp. NPDC048197]